MHVDRVRRWLIVASLILFHAPVQAEWISLEPQYQLHPLQTAYIDPGTTRREGHLVALSALIDWKTMQGGRSPTRFYSTILSKQFDCERKRARSLASIDFDGHMGTGDPIDGNGYLGGGIWLDVKPLSLDQGLWETACRAGLPVDRQ
jgi:hypothetical protein